MIVRLGFVAAMIAFVGALGIANSTSLTQEPDLPGGHFIDDNGNLHEANIEAIAIQGITLGCNIERTAYCPDLKLNRAQMASLLARAFDLPPGTDGFADVSQSNVHSNSISALATAGITQGCAAGPDLFCPWDLVSRAQMASFMARALELDPDPNIQFDDVNEASPHGVNITAIAGAGITLGCDATGQSFCPENSVTRAQMASFLARGLELPVPDLQKRIDLLPQEAICSGDPRSCQADMTVTSTSGFYILEGFFYKLPYLEGDSSSFTDAEFRLFIDGVELSGMASYPRTTFGTTILRLGGWVLDDLGPGTYDVEAQWWWEGELLISGTLDLTVTS